MMAGVKKFVARTQLNRLRRQMPSPTFQYPDVLRNTRKILICLPGELRELTTIKQFLPEIRDLFKPATVTLLAMPGLQISDIFPRKGFNILTPSADQLAWAGLASKSYIQFLRDYKFDVVMDLNLGASDFTSSILLSLPEAVRIGRGNHLGRPYYNLEIKTKYLRDERNIYRSLIETLRHLRDGQTQDEPEGSEEQAEQAVARDDAFADRRNGVSEET